MSQVEFRRRRVLGEAEKRAHVLRQSESGKTIAAFCRSQGIALSSFQNWKRKFTGNSSFVEVTVPSPVRSAVPVEVVLASGEKICTTSGCDPVWLAAIVRSLGTAPC